MLAMVWFGVGEILGCLFIGYLVDRIGSKMSSIVNLGIIAIMLGVTFGFL
jgi:predicted MFS family arabinose efflux permease